MSKCGKSKLEKISTITIIKLIVTIIIIIVTSYLLVTSYLPSNLLVTISLVLSFRLSKRLLVIPSKCHIVMVTFKRFINKETLWSVR
jgi:hypothetical protein